MAVRSYVFTKVPKLKYFTEIVKLRSGLNVLLQCQALKNISI